MNRSLLSPLAGMLTARRLNRTLHGRSVHRKEDVPGHNVILGYSRPGVGDALDLFAVAGEPVYAMHSGRVVRAADIGGRLSCVYISGSGITTVYAHLNMRDRVKVGALVNEGEVIGWIGGKLADPHLHLEVWVGGRAVSARKPVLLAERVALLCGARQKGAT